MIHNEFRQQLDSRWTPGPYELLYPPFSSNSLSMWRVSGVACQPLCSFACWLVSSCLILSRIGFGPSPCELKCVFARIILFYIVFTCFHKVMQLVTGQPLRQIIQTHAPWQKYLSQMRDASQKDDPEFMEG